MKRTPQKHPSLLSILSIHSIPSQQPMRIRLGSISGIKLTLAGFISRPKEAESRNPQKRSRRDYFSGSSPSFSSKWPRRDYFGPSPHSRACKGPDADLVPQPQTHQGCTQARPQGRAIFLQQSGCHSVSHLPQSPPRSPRPDLVLEVGLEPPAAELTSCFLREELPPVILEIPSRSPELEEELPRDTESHQCPDTPGKWFWPPTWSPPR